MRDEPVNRPEKIICAAVMFDMDGTLVDSTAVVNRLWQEWCARQGIALNEVLRISHGRRTVDVVAQVAPHLDAIHEARQMEEREISELDGIVEVPGAAALLQILPGDRWCVVTSASRALAVARMRKAGLPASPVLITSEDVREGKPSEEGYLKGARSLGLPPTQCVVFEDAPAGIEAAVRSGAVVIRVSATSASASSISAPHIATFRELNCTVLPDGNIEIAWQSNSTRQRRNVNGRINF